MLRLGSKNWLRLMPWVMAVLYFTACGEPRVTVNGPKNVPDFSAYAYTTNCTNNPTWTISDQVGTIASGQGTPNVNIRWGQGPKQVDISVACGADSGIMSVKVMQVTITDPNITARDVEDGDHDPDPAYQYARLGDNNGAPPSGKPGITFDATITVTGPTAGSDGPNRITTGFVQVLREIPQWEGDYADGDRRLVARFGQGPPWHDQVKGDSDASKAWYTKHVGATFTPSPGKLTASIQTWDRPKAGWPAKNTQGKALEEATATWKFETYICVQTSDAPDIYFNRAKAKWSVIFRWTAPDNVSGSSKEAPQQFSLLQDYSHPDPITGMKVNDGINSPNRTFEKP